jgi:choline monooxygenase
VHKNSLVGQATISNTVTFDAFGWHARIAVPGKGMLDLPDDAEPSERHFSVIYFIYPNLIISNTLLGCEIIEARPAGSPDRAVLRHTLLSKVDVGALTGGTNDQYLETIRSIVLNEDGAIITSSGEGIADAGHEFVQLGRNEIGCQHIHRQIADGIQQGRVASGSA